jgi:hypothetical protein
MAMPGNDSLREVLVFLLFVEIMLTSGVRPEPFEGPLGCTVADRCGVFVNLLAEQSYRHKRALDTALLVRLSIISLYSVIFSPRGEP